MHLPELRTFRSLLPVLLVLALFLPSQAQNTGDGTIYSRFGIGELRSFSSPQAEALGGGGYGLRSLNYVSLANPATLGDQVLTRAVAGVRYQNLRAMSEGSPSSVLSEGNLGAIQFSFPLVNRRLGMGFGFEPFSRVTYRVQLNGSTAPDPAEPDTIDYRIDFEGAGGLQQFSGGIGFQISPALAVGASAQLLFGVIDYGRHTTFPGTSLRPADFVTSTRLSGFTGTVGATYTVSRILRQNDDLTVGAFARLPTSLDARRVRTLGESLERDTLGTMEKGSVTLPVSIGLGLGYQPGSRWVVTINGLYEPWTNFRSDLSFPGMGLEDQGAMRDRVRVSGGAEIRPAGNNLLAPYFARTAYRLGASYDRYYVTPIAGRDITTLAITGGLSLPTLLSGTRLDVNFEVGTRGTADHQLVRDVFYRVSLNLNVGERWFQKQRLR